jgi:hypothetical protein
MRRLLALWLLLPLAGCGGKLHLLTAHQVLAALRAQGLHPAIIEDLRGPVPPGAPYAANKQRGVRLMISGDRNVDACVYDSASHAHASYSFGSRTEMPVLGGRGRAFLVDNVVVEALEPDSVRAAARAAAELRRLHP